MSSTPLTSREKRVGEKTGRRRGQNGGGGGEKGGRGRGGTDATTFHFVLWCVCWFIVIVVVCWSPP